jgi:hypothetical protein
MPGWELVYEPKTKKSGTPVSVNKSDSGTKSDSDDENDDDICINKHAANAKCVIDLSLFAVEE